MSDTNGENLPVPVPRSEGGASASDGPRFGTEEPDFRTDQSYRNDGFSGNPFGDAGHGQRAGSSDAGFSPDDFSSLESEELRGLFRDLLSAAEETRQRLAEQLGKDAAEEQKKAPVYQTAMGLMIASLMSKIKAGHNPKPEDLNMISSMIANEAIIAAQALDLHIANVNSLNAMLEDDTSFVLWQQKFRDAVDKTPGITDPDHLWGLINSPELALSPNCPVEVTALRNELNQIFESRPDIKSAMDRVNDSFKAFDASAGHIRDGITIIGKSGKIDMSIWSTTAERLRQAGKIVPKPHATSPGSPNLAAESDPISMKFEEMAKAVRAAIEKLIAAFGIGVNPKSISPGMN